MGAKLPGPTTLPTAAQALPEANRLPNGIVYQPKDVLGWNGVGPGALGFYKDGDRRWRTLAIFKDDADQAKDTFKTIKSKPGTLPVAAIGDDAAHVVVAPPGGGPKIELLVVRKGNAIWGIADEEYALRGPDKEKARLTKEEAVAKIKPLLAGGDAGAAGGQVAPPAPSGASSAAPKK